MISISNVIKTEVAALENQVAQLQARIAALGECESETAGAVSALRAAVGKVVSLAPGAVDSLRQTVLDLFNVGCESGVHGNDGNQGDGGQPVVDAPLEVLRPTPQKSEPLLNGQTCEIDPDAHWVVAKPDGSRWEWASPLACLVEDAPLAGQFTELTCAATSNVEPVYEDTSEFVPMTLEQRIAIDKALGEEIEAEENLFKLVSLTNNTAYMKKEDGQICCAYVAANNKANLKRWGEFLTVTHTVGTRFEVREAKRLASWKYELKLWGLSFEQIEKLSACDISKDPRKCLPDAPVRKPERVPSMLEIENIGVGDIVRSVTVRHWQYKVVEVNLDGFYVCERLGVNPPIIQVLHPGSVEIAVKANVINVQADAVDESSVELVKHLESQVQAFAPGIDETDIPRGVVLKPTDDDLLVESTVWMWALVRNQGVPEKQLKQIGRLVEGINGIEAYRPRAGICQVFSRTLHAVDYLIQCSGQKPADILEQKAEVLVGATATGTDDDEF